LDDISISLNREDFVSVVGPNGAGKTTLIRCLLGLLPCKGEVLLNGSPISKCSRKEIARSIAYVPQVVGLLPAVSVEQFVSIGRYAHRNSFFGIGQGDGDKEVVYRALESTDCFRFKDRIVSTVSGGERQRILIAAALAQDPELLLLDEPASFLDPKHEVELYRMLKGLHTERGIGICMINHDINSASNVSSRVIALQKGRLAFDGSVEQFMTEEVLERLYQTGFSIVANPNNSQKSAIMKF
jgi:iron complex transport system ATP-binding protein